LISSHHSQIRRAIVRHMLGMVLLAAVAGTQVPATALAATQQVSSPVVSSPGPQRFGVRLVDIPVSEAHNPRGLRYIIDFLRPGTVIHRRIFIANEEPHRAHFTVYPDAARITHGYFIGDAGHTRSELTTWITIRRPSVTLGPHAATMDMVTIKVPRIATRGEHYGAIWLQQVTRARSSTGFTVRQIGRVGIRIYLAVGPGGAPPTKFAITSITGSRTRGGAPLLTARVHNTGGRAVDLAGTASLTGGPGNTSAGPYRARQVVSLAPGQSGAITFLPARRLPSGPWRATVTLVSGLTVRKATATVRFSNHQGAAWLSSSAMIWTGGGLLAALFALFVVLSRRGRRPGRPRRGSLPRSARA
jgi:hypothetical protein